MKISDVSNVAVFGCGSFGTVVANLIASNGLRVNLWARSHDTALSVQNDRINRRYHPKYELHKNITVTNDLKVAMTNTQLVFFAVPINAYSELAHNLKPILMPDIPIVSTAKGFDERFLLPSQVLKEKLPDNPNCTMSGPNIAAEIVSGDITATVVASECNVVRSLVREVLSSDILRVYENTDQFGVELAGALKNIYAIVSGMTEASGAGQNTKSLIFTRGVAEMNRFCKEMGANPMTMMGLGGIGDLFVTCTSPLSRNYRVGIEVGRGASLDEALSSIGQVAEGVNTTKLVKVHADSMGIYMPLLSSLHAILFEGCPIRETVRKMMLSTHNVDVEME